MLTWKPYLGPLFGLLLLAQIGYAQPRFSATLDSTRFLIGDQLNLTLTAKFPQGYLVGEPDLSPLTTVESPLELLDAPQDWDTIAGTGTVILEKKLRITAWDTGYFQVPVIKTPFRLRANVDTLYTNQIPFEVQGIQVDTTLIAPIKTIIREPITWRDYLPYLYQLLAILAIVFLVIYFMRRARKEQEVEIPNLDLRRPAYVIALERINDLRSRDLLQAGAVKEYYTELVEILRRYLEQGYFLATREATTTDILKQVRQKMGTESPWVSGVQHILQEGDLVKFANASPAKEAIAQTTGSLQTFVEQTRATGISQGETYYSLVGEDQVLQDAVEAGLKVYMKAEDIHALYPELIQLPSYSAAQKPVKINRWKIAVFGQIKRRTAQFMVPQEIRAWYRKSTSASTNLFEGIVSLFIRVPFIGGLLFYLTLFLLSPILLVLCLLDLFQGKLPFGRGKIVLRNNGVVYFKVMTEEVNYSFAPIPVHAKSEEE